MTDLQTALIVGIPTLSVLGAMWRADKRIDSLAFKADAGSSKIDRFDQVDAEHRFFRGTMGELKEALAAVAQGWAMTTTTEKVKAGRRVRREDCGGSGARARSRHTKANLASARETYCNHG